MTKLIPTWFQKAIRSGVNRLLVLSLGNTPPPDVIGKTAEAWIIAIWEERNWSDSDEARIAAAFDRLSVTIEFWPAPKKLLDLLPRKQIIHKSTEGKRSKSDPQTERARGENLSIISHLLKLPPAT